ncbi:hypothetical protein VPH35_064995 [Triticum aestivum]
MDDSGDETEHRRRARSDGARKWGGAPVAQPRYPSAAGLQSPRARGLRTRARPSPPRLLRQLVRGELIWPRVPRVLIRGLIKLVARFGEEGAGGAVKREPEEALPDAPPRRGVIGPEDSPPVHPYPQGQEELLERVVLERSAREQEEMEELIRRELEYEWLFFEMGVMASQAHASKEADMRVMMAEQVKLYIDLDSDSSDSD